MGDRGSCPIKSPVNLDDLPVVDSSLTPPARFKCWYEPRPLGGDSSLVYGRSFRDLERYLLVKSRLEVIACELFVLFLVYRLSREPRSNL